jgi:hypothetical protein
MMLNGSNLSYVTKGCTDGFDYCTMINTIICPVYNATSCLCETCSTDRCNDNQHFSNHSILMENNNRNSVTNEVENNKTFLYSKSIKIKYEFFPYFMILIISIIHDVFVVIV